jgi:hypothetical protein
VRACCCLSAVCRYNEMANVLTDWYLSPASQVSSPARLGDVEADRQQWPSSSDMPEALGRQHKPPWHTPQHRQQRLTRCGTDL